MTERRKEKARNTFLPHSRVEDGTALRCLVEYRTMHGTWPRRARESSIPFFLFMFPLSLDTTKIPIFFSRFMKPSSFDSIYFQTNPLHACESEWSFLETRTIPIHHIICSSSSSSYFSVVSYRTLVSHIHDTPVLLLFLLMRLDMDGSWDFFSLCREIEGVSRF
jgi:hypothetical protein